MPKRSAAHGTHGDGDGIAISKCPRVNDSRPWLMFIDSDCDDNRVIIPVDSSDEDSDLDMSGDKMMATESHMESSPGSITNGTGTDTTAASPRENAEHDQDTIVEERGLPGLPQDSPEWWIPTSEDEAVEAYNASANAHGNDEGVAFEGARFLVASQGLPRHAQPYNVDVIPQTPPELLRRVPLPQTPPELLMRAGLVFSPHTPEGPPPPSPEGHSGTTRRSSFMTLARRRERRNIFRGNSPTHATLSSMNSPPSDWESPSPESA